jgi:hypothetical protein
MSLGATMLRSNFISHFGDSTSANAAIVRGYASTRDTAIDLSSFSLFMARENAGVWIDYVPGQGNIAD